MLADPIHYNRSFLCDWVRYELIRPMSQSVSHESATDSQSGTTRLLLLEPWSWLNMKKPSLEGHRAYPQRR